MRRGGARREVSDRVTLRAADRTLEGWALNVSRGGVRVIVEDAVQLGEVFDITLGAGDHTPTRSGRVVWLQEEPDGMVCGLAFTLAADEGPKSVPPPPPGSRTLP